MSFFRRLFGKSSGPGSDVVESSGAVEADAQQPDGLRHRPFSLPVLPALQIATDTATVVVFDLAALRHRQEDDCDWWADPREELKELQARNVLIFGLGSDGYYDLEVGDAIDGDAVRYSLSVPSGEVYIGPGEELTGGDFEPDGTHGGFFLRIPPGNYAVSATMADNLIKLQIVQAAEFANSQTEPLRLA